MYLEHEISALQRELTLKTRARQKLSERIDKIRRRLTAIRRRKTKRKGYAALSREIELAEAARKVR